MQLPLLRKCRGWRVSGEALGAPAHTRLTRGDNCRIPVQYMQSAVALVNVRTLVRGALTADFVVVLSNFKSGFKSKTYVVRALAVR